MTIRSVGIVGYGAFGGLVDTLLRRFAPTIEMRIYSSRHEPDGARFFALEDVAACDVIVLAVPINAFEVTLQKLLPLVRPDSIIVDVATVKVHTVTLLKKYAAAQPYIAMHPMWGPESYEKRGGNVSGFRIVLAAHSIEEEEYAALRSALEGIGFDVVEMTAEVHDKHLAETLFLTHFIGQIVSDAGFNRTEIDTVSFGYLMDAVESVKHDTALFKDVYRFNPYCIEILERFNVSEEKVKELLK